MTEYTEEEIKWAYSLIQPELPEYDEKDHEIAKLRYILSEVHEHLYDLYFYSGAEGEQYKKYNTPEEIGKKIHDFLYNEDGYCDLPDGTSKEDINDFAKKRNWEYYSTDMGPTGYHVGDCTAVPASCSKCYAEQFYDFKTPYEGKHSGWKALHIFQNVEKQKQEQAITVFEEMRKNNKIGVHMSHCFDDDPECFGGYKCCKYGDEFCPADPKYSKIIVDTD